MVDQETDYRRWKKIDYHPTIASFLPESLLPLLARKSSVLEIGCGEGTVCRYLASAGLTVTGIDINASAIEAARNASITESISSRIHYRAADILDIDDIEQFDAVLLIRVLTCFPDERDWRRLLDRANAALREGGLLYIHDFAYDPDNVSYARRYEEGVTQGWRRGSFAVRPQGNDLAFVAFHHDDIAIAEISSSYESLRLNFHNGESMTGNRVRMVEFIGKKITAR
jgi:SAM-dependent methyltransferase